MMLLRQLIILALTLSFSGSIWANTLICNVSLNKTPHSLFTRASEVQADFITNCGRLVMTYKNQSQDHILSHLYCDKYGIQLEISNYEQESSLATISATVFNVQSQEVEATKRQFISAVYSPEPRHRAQINLQTMEGIDGLYSTIIGFDVKCESINLNR